MNTTLLVLDDNNQWRELDLFEDLPINVIIQETDLTEITSRRSPYSKTFEIPGTSINNEFFEHFYEVNGTGFDPLTKRSCVVQYRGTDIFKGFLRLNSITVDGDRIGYEVYILSEVTDFSSIILETELKKLNWNNYNHVQNYDTVTMSWLANSGNTQGLFNGDILYPMIHYGLEYQGTGYTTQFQFAINTIGNTGFDFSGSAVNPSYFKPAIRLKSVLNKIFEESGYQVESDFFDTPYFESIYLDLAANGKIGIETASGKTNQNTFRVYGNALPQAQQFRYENGSIQQIYFDRIGTTDGYDPSLNFNETFGVYQAPVSGLYSFEFFGKINQLFNNNTVVTYYGLTIFKSSTIQGLFNPSTRTAVGGTPDNLIALNYNNVNNQRIFMNNVQLSAGDYIGLFIRFNNSTSSNRFAGLWVGPYEWQGSNFGARWDLYDAPVFTQNNFVDMKLQIPDTSAFDFFKAIMKMFNLVIIQSPQPKTFRIEPYNWYYSEQYANKLDWTSKLDINSPYTLEPVNYQLQKSWNFQYEPAEEEHLGKLWEEQYVVPFGTRQFRAIGDILQGESTMEFPFRPLPSETISGSTNIIIPKVYDLDVATGKEIPYSQKNHLFFWNGNRFMYGQSGYTQPSKWWLLSGATPIEWTTYPCVNHLSTLDSVDSERISDLNFDKNFDFFGNQNPGIVQFTEYNLYQTFWGDYFTNLYSPETRRLTGRFLFNPVEIGELDLRDRVFIKDSYFSIERVNEADLVNWKLTEVSLLKEVVPYNKIVPPPPDHSIYPNEPFPASGAIYTLSAYVATDQFLLCTNSVTGQTIYASTPTIADFTFVYVDNIGTPYPQGYFVQETSATTIFSTVNYLGQVLQNDC